MKTQELKIEAPEGYEVDWDNSSNNVIKNLYSRGCYYINNNPTSTKQLEQLLALNNLMNVAKYLNGDWKPDFTDIEERKWYINYDFENLILGAYFIYTYRHSHAYFKSEELALQAIEILGEKEVKKALGIFE